MNLEQIRATDVQQETAGQVTQKHSKAEILLTLFDTF